MTRATCRLPGGHSLMGMAVVCAVLMLLPVGLPGDTPSAGRFVVLDPGHGGPDAGAVGPGGTSEKQVTLSLAWQIRDELGSAYRVVLTRSDDYAVALVDRTAVANHLNADLFISLHTGAGFAAHQDAMDVFVCGPGGADREAMDARRAANGPWYDGFRRHIPESRELAERLGYALVERFDPIPMAVTEAPIAVLAGADMPAVLLEIGYLTHPATENRLRHEDTVTALAQAIANGIDDYFQVGHPPATFELRE